METPKSTPIQQLPQQTDNVPVQQQNIPNEPQMSQQNQMPPPPMTPQEQRQNIPLQQNPNQMVPPQMSNPNDPNINPAINSSNSNNGIVDEILSEIENTHLQEAPEDRQGSNVANFQRHMDNEVNSSNLRPSASQVEEMTEQFRQEQEYDPEQEQLQEQLQLQKKKLPVITKTKTEQILELAKLVTLLVFMSQFKGFNSIISKIPKTINSQGQLTMVGSFAKSITVGIMFTVLSHILNK